MTKLTLTKAEFTIIERLLESAIIRAGDTLSDAEDELKHCEFKKYEGTYKREIKECERYIKRLDDLDLKLTQAKYHKVVKA